MWQWMQKLYCSYMILSPTMWKKKTKVYYCRRKFTVYVITCRTVVLFGYKFTRDIYLGGGVTNQHEIVHGSRAMIQICLIPFGGNIIRGLQMWDQKRGIGLVFRPLNIHLTVNISKMVRCSITCQLELNMSLTGAFQKCVTWGSSSQGRPHKATCVEFLCIFLSSSTLKLYSF